MKAVKESTAQAPDPDYVAGFIVGGALFLGLSILTWFGIVDLLSRRPVPLEWGAGFLLEWVWWKVSGSPDWRPGWTHAPHLRDMSEPNYAYLSPSFEIFLLLAFSISVWVGWKVSHSNVISERHVSGLRLLKGKKGAKVLSAALEKLWGKADGIFIHPLVQLPQRLEVRCFLVMGAAGAGKTTVLNHVVDQAVARRDKVIVYDFKGDFTMRIPAKDRILFGEWDRRSARWILGRDIDTELLAKDLSECLIPVNAASKDPVWDDASRAILRAELHKLMARKPGEWSFSDLGKGLMADVLHSPKEKLLDLVETWYPEGFRIVEDFASRATSSVLFTQSAQLADTIFLARLDHEHEKMGKKGGGLREYLISESAKPIILKSCPDSRSLTRAYFSCVVNTLAAILSGFDESSPQARRIWIVLDEVPQLGKIPLITTFLETGRSKGVRTVVAFQEQSQVEKVYSKEERNIWDNTTAVKIWLQSYGNEAKKYASDLVGAHEVEKYQLSHNTGIAPPHLNKTTNWQQMTKKLIEPSDLESLLRADSKGVTGILQIGGEDRVILKWPHKTYETVAQANAPLVLPQRGEGEEGLFPSSPPRPLPPTNPGERERKPEKEEPIKQPEKKEGEKGELPKTQAQTVSPEKAEPSKQTTESLNESIDAGMDLAEQAGVDLPPGVGGFLKTFLEAAGGEKTAERVREEADHSRRQSREEDEEERE